MRRITPGVCHAENIAIHPLPGPDGTTWTPPTRTQQTLCAHIAARQSRRLRKCTTSWALALTNLASMSADRSSAAETDRALVEARSKLAWYSKASTRSNRANVASNVLLLLAGAATTIAAAVEASVWVTAPLAGLTFVLTGARSVFHWNELAVSRTIAREELRREIALYEVELNRGDEGTHERQRQLVEQVYEIAAADLQGWANRRRQQQQGIADQDGGTVNSPRDLG